MVEVPKHDLAVVVPAFKPDFLAKALESLCQQTDQKFSLYIFDDASPANIRLIVETVLGDRPYSYRRFEHNLGATSIAKHWDRCLAPVQEPWVWFFSDDDIMDSRCVEAFHAFGQAEGNEADVVRFDGWIIDEADKIIELFPTNYDKESWLEFAYGCLMNWRRAFLQQLIFRTEVLKRTGFLDLPMGWSADYAAIIAAGRQKPIRRIPRACVYWRQSQKNTAPDESLKARKKKLHAVCLFLQWLKRVLDEPREHLFDEDDTAFRRAMDRCLVEAVMCQGSLSALANLRLLLNTRAKVCGASRLALVKYVAVAGVKDTISGIGSVAHALAGKFAA